MMFCCTVEREEVMRGKVGRLKRVAVVEGEVK